MSWLVCCCCWWCCMPCRLIISCTFVLIFLFFSCLLFTELYSSVYIFTCISVLIQHEIY